jgi:ribosomal protein L37AE/L43A
MFNKEIEDYECPECGFETLRYEDSDENFWKCFNCGATGHINDLTDDLTDN